ncbi:MAG TPA: Ig-like domain-containing protein [Pyrinomonadaceae bacterium]|nr:Ig-like domain-containing protein [Pyrinomonadaceae bacterium]
MRPVIDQTHRTPNSFFGISARSVLKLLTICLIVALVPIALYVRVKSEYGRFAVADSKKQEPITVHAAGRARPFFNFQDGRQISANFSGAAAQALQSGQAQARALAAGDLDANAVPDVVAGYRYGGTGIVTIQRGNPEAYAPRDKSVYERMQNGYNPDALLPEVETITTPEPADFLQIGDFNGDSHIDILSGARGGDLFLLANDGNGGFLAPQQIQLPGSVTALAAGEFRAADGKLDVAVGVNGPGGTELLIFDGANGGLTGAPMQFPLTSEASVIRLDGMDDDPFVDAVVAAGSDVLIVHGWGRKESPVLSSRIERVSTPSEIHGLAVGNFNWNRQGRPDLAVLAPDGSVQVLQSKGVNTTALTDQELSARRARGRVQAPQSEAARYTDVEAVRSWNVGRQTGWAITQSVAANASPKSGNPESALTKTNLLSRETEEIIATSSNELKILRRGGAAHVSGAQKNSEITAAATADSTDISQVSLSSETSPVAVVQLPQKLNGERDLIMLQDGSTNLSVVPLAPVSITVDRTDDPSGASLTAASACTAAGSDCSLRGAIQLANTKTLSTDQPTTINIPAGTYTLAINGAGGCVTEGASGNTIGDLELNEPVTILGAGSASTIIRQHGTGAANAGDRVMCLNEGFLLNLAYSFTGISIIGGRESNTIGGAGIIGGEKGNSLTLNDVTIANNQVINGNIGGAGIQITGGDLTINNSLIGGTSAPQATFDPSITANRDTVANANKNNTSSGGGLYFTPSAPQHSASTGNLVVTGTTFNHNVAGTNGGGAELEIFNVGAGNGTGSATFDTSTFTNNQATNGGGIQVASLPSTLGSIAGTLSFTSNSASNDGGAVHQAGSTLSINGTTATINFASNNTAPFGSSVSLNSAGGASLSGTHTTIGGDFAVLTNGVFTANAGSSMSPQNFRILGGTANLNNSTINVTGDFQIGRETTNAGILNANSATVSIQGNLVVDLTPAGAGTNGQFNAGTSTFNFNGTVAQSASNAGPGTPVTFFNLTDSNTTQPVTISNSINVSNTLNVNGANAILNPAATTVIAGAGTLTGTGTARATRTAVTADFLNQYTITNKTLTNLTIDYNGAGNQTVNNTPPYSNLVISGSGTKTLQGNTAITGSLNIVAATFASGNFNFALGGNWTNAATFTPGTGTVTFQGSTGTQTLTGSTTFFNLTLNNSGATTNFSNTTTTIGNDLVASAGTMDGGTSTIIFTGVTDNAGSISGAAAKNFHNLQINSPATISNSSGGAINILNDYANAGTFSQSAGQSTVFASGPDNTHAMSGAGASTFGLFTINTGNTVNAGSHNFIVAGSAFTVTGTGVFNGGTGTVTFGAGGQTITGDGSKNFGGLLINNTVQVANGTGAVDAAVGGTLTLNTDLTVAAGAILQQSGSSAGNFDVLGTVRRTDLGAVERPFGHAGNTITINSGTPPTQVDFNLVKVVPASFPAGVKVVPRDITITPVGGSGISATLKTRYIDPTELTPSSISEGKLVLWKNISGTWTPQGGSPDTTNNFVSLSSVSSFSEWAMAEASDLTLSKANNVSGSAVVGQSWNWTLTAANTGSPATFTTGQVILSDDLPNSNLNYGTPTVQNVSNVTGSANISCSIASNTLTCTANGGSVTFASNIGASNFDVVFSATPQAAGSYQNPRTGGGVAKIDPNLLIVESNENNNTPTNNTVTVGKANTTTTINSDLPDPSVVGQPVTVTWSVTVNAPGSLGTPLTGNVTVSDGTNQCVAAVSAGQCDVTFTSAGAKNLTATYAGDTNYNGSASSPATAHTVNKADTTTTITSDNPDPSTPGQSVTVQWTTTVNAPGAGTPTGNVTVTASGGAETCNAPVATGQCSITLNTTGARTLTATYAGDTNFNTSNDTEAHQVCGSAVVTTTADSGAGSLRQIITDACDGSTITFDAAAFATPQTITLTTGELLIDKNLTIKAGSTQVITISGNNASRVFHVNTGRTVSIVGLTISGGSAANGGAILNDSVLTVVNSTLTGNAATNDGGAISSSATATGLTLINTTISGNTAAGSGGGIIVLGGTATSTNSTITNNSADSDNNSLGDGGGIRVQAGTFLLKNTIVAGNFNEDGASDAADDISGTVDPTSSFNLIGTGGAGGLTNGVNNNQTGVANPGLGALANNGGTTQTHALLQGSAAIEAGSNANLPVDTFDLDGDANTAETLPVDQRGPNFPRVADSADADAIQTVDIGAYEAHPTIQDITDKTTAEDTAVPQITFNIGDGTGSLITSVTATSSNTTLIPNANVVVNGSGSSRTLDITPAANANSPADGTSTITVTVTATNGRTATDTFVVTVTEVNDAPVPTNDTIADIAEDCASGCTGGKYVIPFATLLGNDTNKGAPNESAQTLNITAVSAPTGGTVAINGTNVEFTPTADYFGPAGFTYTVTDNGTTNGVSDPKTGNATVSFNVTAVNDPPSFTIAGNPPSVNQDAGPQTVNNFATNISAGPNETGQTLTFNVSPTGSTGTLTFSTAPAINSTTGTLTYTPTNGTNGTATFSVTLSDNGSNTPPNSNTSGAQSFTITVNSPNATPVVTTTAGNLAYTENDPATVIDSGLTVTDSDSANLTGATVSITAGFVSAQDTLAFTDQLGITGSYNSGSGVLTLSGTTTVANYQTALRTVTYQNSSDNPTASRTITFSATDGFTIGSATRDIAITAVNDAPVNTVPGPQSTNEDTAKVFSSGNGNQISVADVDLNANSIKITLTAANGTISLASIGGLSFTSGDGTNDATMVFTGSLANVNTALNGLSFTPTLDFNGVASLQIVSDDQGNTGTGGPLTDTDSVNITVNGANDAPVVTASGGNLSYTENGAAAAIDSGLTVADNDSPNLTGATVAITGNFASGQDVLAFTNQLGITGNYNSGTGVLTLTGTASVANYQTALRSVTYQNSSDNPSTAIRTVTFTVNDGTTTGSATRGISVTAVNDAPVNVVPGSQTTPQNTPLVFSGGNGNQISVTDVDAGANAIQVTLTATNGTLTLSGTGGLSFSFSDANGTGAGDGTADATMTFRGTLTNVNAALNGMSFTPTAAFTGSANVSITSNDLGNTGTGGPLTDTDSVAIQVGVTNISIADSSLTEPTSGSANMVFTVTLSAPAPAGGVTVHFATQEQAPALNHATAGQDYTSTSGTLTFAQGEQIGSISVSILSDNKKNEANETFLVVLSNPVGGTITTGTATGTILITAQPPGTILITELRTSGPAGAGDDFVEIYNNSDSPHTVNDGTGINDAAHGYGLYKLGATCGANPILIGVIPNGTVIPKRGHYLFVGSAYSLSNYGGTGAAAGDQTLIQDIESDRNVGIFSTTSVANLSNLTRLDAVGFGANSGSGVCDLLREGTTLTPLSGSVLEYSYFRDECGKKGNPANFGNCPTSGFVMDSNDNDSDFIFADTAGTATPAGQRLGAPGPQNMGNPRLNLSIATLLLDATKGSTTDPNRVRDTTPQGPLATQGTLSVRRRFVNNTGAPVTRLRFRIVDFSAFPVSGATADLRALSSSNITVSGIKDSATCAATGTPSSQPCTVTVFGTALETPPTQALGGALNSSYNAGTISLPTPLAPGQSINLQFLLGVQKTGSFKFFFNIEALP